MTQSEMQLELQKIRLDLAAVDKKCDLHFEELTRKCADLMERQKDVLMRMEKFMDKMEPVIDFFKTGGSLKRGFIWVLKVFSSLLGVGYIVWQIGKVLSRFFHH